MLVSFFSQAQDSIAFNMLYLPMHRYDLNVSQLLTSTTSFEGNDSVMNALSDKGISNPTVVKRDIEGETAVITGQYNDIGVMPVKLIYLNLRNDKGDILIPSGSGLAGTAHEGKMPVFDSVILADKNDTTIRDVLLKVKNIFSQIKLPDSKMKLGDKYIYSTSLNIPIATIMMKMIISITYKLNSVTDSIAGFDLNMKIILDASMASMGNSIHGTGTGNGIMFYDRVNHFPLKEDLRYKMQASFETHGVNIIVDVISNSSYNYIITKI